MSRTSLTNAPEPTKLNRPDWVIVVGTSALAAVVARIAIAATPMRKALENEVLIKVRALVTVMARLMRMLFMNIGPRTRGLDYLYGMNFSGKRELTRGH